MDPIVIKQEPEDGESMETAILCPIPPNLISQNIDLTLDIEEIEIKPEFNYNYEENVVPNQRKRPLHLKCPVPEKKPSIPRCVGRICAGLNRKRLLAARSILTLPYAQTNACEQSTLDDANDEIDILQENVNENGNQHFGANEIEENDETFGNNLNASEFSAVEHSSNEQLDGVEDEQSDNVEDEQLDEQTDDIENNNFPVKVEAIEEPVNVGALTTRRDSAINDDTNFICSICSTFYTTKNGLHKHYKRKVHLDKLAYLAAVAAKQILMENH